MECNLLRSLPSLTIEHTVMPSYARLRPRCLMSALKVLSSFIIGWILFFFDTSSTYSYVFVKFSLVLDLVYDVLNYSIYLSTPIEDTVVVTHMYWAYFVLFIGFKTWVNLFIFYMIDFDII